MHRSPQLAIRRVARALSLLLVCLSPVSESPADSVHPGASGSLAGEVVIGPKLLGRRMRFSLYPDLRGQTRAPDAAEVNEVENVVVYLEDGPTGSPTAAAAFEMAQKDGAFVPHVLPIVRGSTVQFPNADLIYHNVFSLSRAAAFDLGRYPRGESRSVRFESPGIVKVFCHIHSDMSGVVLVLPNPHFARPDEQGRFRIERIPPGEYTVVAWHERAPRAEMRVRIRGGETEAVRFEIPLEQQADRAR